MRQHQPRPVLVRLRTFLALSGLCWAHSAFAQNELLQLHTPTLTTYSATLSPAQELLPRHQQRAANIDGSLSGGTVQGWGVAANPFESGNTGQRRFGDIDLVLGNFAPSAIDLTLPTPSSASAWTIAREYGHRQGSGNDADSDGLLGYNWAYLAQPEIRFVADSTAADDTVVIVLGANRYLTFKRIGTGSDTFRGVNGAAGAVVFVPGTAAVPPNAAVPPTYRYQDQRGNTITFFGDHPDSNNADWQFWKSQDADGNTAYVGDKTTAATAYADGYSNQRILVAYDGAANDGRRYTHTHAVVGTKSRLTEVKIETKSGGTWSSPTGLTEVGRVSYTYYTNDADDHGKAGDLKLVSVRTPLSPSGATLSSGVYAESNTYYRYYDNSWLDQDGRRGVDRLIKMVVGAEGTRSFDWDQDGNLDGDYLSATDAALKPYAQSFVEYENSATQRRVAKIWTNGSCGCSGSPAGATTFTYSTNGSHPGGAGYDSSGSPAEAIWKDRAVIAQPDGTYVTQYFDETGQPLSRVMTNADPAGSFTKLWASELTRNASGQVTHLYSPEAIETIANSGYTHSTGAFSRRTSEGLITVIDRSTTSIYAGLEQSRRTKKGAATADSSGTVLSYTGYTYAGFQIAGQTYNVYRPLVQLARRYHTATTDASDTTKFDQTDYTYVDWGASGTDLKRLALKTVTTQLPAISTAKNGKGVTSGDRIESVQHLRLDGSLAWQPEQAFTGTTDSNRKYSYTGFDNGRPTKAVSDVKTTQTTKYGLGFLNFWAIPETISAGYDLETTSTFDALGRLDTRTSPSLASGSVHKAYYTRLADGRSVALSIPRFVTASNTAYGPVSYSVRNHAGAVEFEGTIAIAASGTTTALSAWVSTASSDPITALAVGTLSSMSSSLFDKSGTRRLESRAYFSIPASGAGTASANYDATLYGYDDSGRVRRVKQPSGTIGRTTFDELGRATASFTGTNDANFAGGELSGTDDMVKVTEAVYDGGASGGNSQLTKTTAFVQSGTTDQRVTEYLYDYRGRRIVQLSPLAPHAVTKYDNLGRALASASYSSPSGLTASTDPTTTTSNRLSLSQTFFDEAGRVYKTQRHKINQSTGADEDNLAMLTWYDEAGRVAKVKGTSIAKTFYDRLGRSTHQFSIALTDDAAYADALTVTGDVVLNEFQTVFVSDTDSSEAMTVSIDRHHNDKGGSYTTGALDTNADGDRKVVTPANVTGRYQITANWYDAQGRLTDTAQLGTNGGSTYTYGSVPTRSDTALVTTYAYDTAGRVQDMTDPRGKVARTLYDSLGRSTTKIANWTGASVPITTPNRDTDLYTRMEFTKGLQTKLWVDLDGDNTIDSDDQVTEYTFGTTKGSTFPDSLIATGHLLREAVYPPQSSGQSPTDRRVRYAYNAQGQVAWTEDQTGTAIILDYDTVGRALHRRATATGSGIDTAVRRISTVFTDRGLVDTITQYDNAAVGSGAVIDQIKQTFDAWGNLTNLEQDRNSVVGQSGSVDDYETQWTYSKSSPSTGREALRVTKQELLYGSTVKQTVNYTYSAASGEFDNLANRVTEVTFGASSPVTIARYAYNGEGSVIRTELPEISTFSTLDAADSPFRTYPNIDRFGRIIDSKWTRDLTTDKDYYRATIVYDRSSSITRVEDKTFTGYDTSYSLDELGRLVRADSGTWNGSGITSRTRDERWMNPSAANSLSQTGNWVNYRLDLNGDGAFAASGELDEARTHNQVNEILSRDTDNNGSANFTLTYNKRGDLTDDGENYTYVYDAFGRLKAVKNRSSGNTVTEYTYNGLNQRIGSRYDSNADGSVNSSDLWFNFQYDHRWRMVATYRSTDTSPKEAFVYHAAGLAGRGSSSYLDSVILRDRDNTNAGRGSDFWNNASDGVLEERLYVLQNWRADVVALVSTDGVRRESLRYSAYGLPTLLPLADYNRDGVIDGGDLSFDLDWQSNDPNTDINFDGVVNGTDYAIWSAAYTDGGAAGRGVVSNLRSRKAYAGYENDGSITRLSHVRNRVLDSGSGRWTRRDPLGYIDGLSLLSYGTRNPLSGKDPLGTQWANFDFVNHFFSGTGGTIDLASVGLLDDYQAHRAVQKHVAIIKNILIAKWRQKGSGLLSQLKCECFGLGPVELNIAGTEAGARFVSRGEFVRSYPGIGMVFGVGQELDFWTSDWTFSIGGHRIFYEAHCEAAASCPSVNHSPFKKWSASCGIQFTMRDTFEDVLDFNDVAPILGINPLPGGLDPYIGGAGYQIYGIFYGGVSASGDVLHHERECYAYP